MLLLRQSKIWTKKQHRTQTHKKDLRFCAKNDGPKFQLFIQFFFKKMGHSRPFFLYFRLFYKQLTVNKCSIKVANDWIRTRVLWYRKRPLCQLRHNHCPFIQFFCCPIVYKGLVIGNVLNILTARGSVFYI